MQNFHFHPIDDALCQHVRESRTDPIFGYDYDVRVSVAGPDGYGPCRQCLQTFDPGERRLLFLHNPFGSELGDYAAPVFIHEAACTPMVPSQTLPAAITALPLMLRSYDARGRWVGERPIRDGDVTTAAQEAFADATVSLIHLRNTEAKCFVVGAYRDDAQPPGR
ncbi:MAG: DUF1203 domain-containing protein [Gammaproteobacteria bacterium]